MITLSSASAKALTLLLLIILVAYCLFATRDSLSIISRATVTRRTAEPAARDLLLVELLPEPEFTSSSNHSSIYRRAEDDYSCRAGRPCHNGACCGASGYCGYGPTYCGTGCISNCKASAECGQYSNPAGKKCPLNTCCSKHGFCGTTKVCQYHSPFTFSRPTHWHMNCPCHKGLLHRWLSVELYPQPFAASFSERRGT